MWWRGLAGGAVFSAVFSPMLSAAPSLAANPASRLPGRAPIIEPSTEVRRVCVQMGVPASSDGTTTRLGGGTYVRLTGRRSGRLVEVGVLRGATAWIPERDPVSGRASLCVAQPTVMRVCDVSAPDGTPIVDDPEHGEPTTLGRIPPGMLVQLWGYFVENGGWSLVEQAGKVGFVRSAALCHTLSSPPDNGATSHFAMRPAPASPNCYQSRRERGSNEIQRIIIHNSEATIERTIASFQECDPVHPTSAHVGIDRDGSIYRFVDDRFAAFHTGGYDGGFNAGSLGIELVAGRRSRSMTRRQERALVALIRYWSKRYGISLATGLLPSAGHARAYDNVEFWEAPVTIHRLVSAGRRTDCPTFLWPDTVEGDKQFFKWRRTRLR